MLIDDLLSKYKEMLPDSFIIPVEAESFVEQVQASTNGPQGRRSAIQYEEFVTDAVVDFTVISDFDIPEEQWAAIWLTGEQNGVGASRSQGFGRYVVTGWELA
jgi:hypothetical protein